MKHALVACLFLACATLPACSEGGSEPRPPPFDFYVLALSWSPSYCEAEGEDANRQQCGNGGPPGFVVHGLWPQYEQGYPEFCGAGDEARFSRRELADLRDLLPSNALIRYQWRKHGSCTGLPRHEYFAAIRTAFERVRIPAMFEDSGTGRSIAPSHVEAAFRQANPGLASDAIATTCEKGRLRDVRICMTREFEFRSCEEVDRRGCRLPRAVMPINQQE